MCKFKNFDQKWTPQIMRTMIKCRKPITHKSHRTRRTNFSKSCALSDFRDGNTIEVSKTYKSFCLNSELDLITDTLFNVMWKSIKQDLFLDDPTYLHFSEETKYMIRHRNSNVTYRARRDTKRYRRESELWRHLTLHNIPLKNNKLSSTSDAYNIFVQFYSYFPTNSLEDE